MTITPTDIAGFLALALAISLGLNAELLRRHRRAKRCLKRLRHERDEARGKLWRQEVVAE